jgi:hypothetical protein
MNTRPDPQDAPAPAPADPPAAAGAPATPPAPGHEPAPIDWSEQSVAGEEDPGASVDED